MCVLCLELTNWRDTWGFVFVFVFFTFSLGLCIHGGVFPYVWELKTDFDKPDRFRLPSFRPRVPVESDPIIFNLVINDPIITDPVVTPFDPNTPPAIETDRFRLPIFKPRSPGKQAPIRHAPGPVRFDPVNPLDLSTPPPPV